MAYEVWRYPAYRHPQSQSRICLSRTGPIPVELLRWKFAEGRTVQLQYNAGLELPSNIGELGDSTLLHGLRNIYLNNNEISKIAPESFNSLSNLTRVELQNNQMISLVSDAVMTSNTGRFILSILFKPIRPPPFKIVAKYRVGSNPCGNAGPGKNSVGN